MTDLNRPSKKADDGSMPRPVFATFKYTGNGRCNESAIVGGKSYFLSYDWTTHRVSMLPAIEEPTRILRPASSEEHPHYPYTFKSIEEVYQILEEARNQTPDSLFQITKTTIQQYVTQDPHKLALFAALIPWGYFQDRFGMTPYLQVIGDNGTGKGSIGDVFYCLGYRPAKGTSITAANYFRLLGIIEPGQCVIIEDEADHIDKDPNKMIVLKSGYERNARVPRMNMNTERQSWYYAYCFKVMIAETSPAGPNAKGLNERSLVVDCHVGEPEFNIKEVQSPAGNITYQGKLAELMHWRKLLLLYRMLHCYDSFSDIETGLKGRDNELCKPLLPFFCKSQCLPEIQQMLQRFIDEKRQAKRNSKQAILYPVVMSAITLYGNQVTVGQIWERLQTDIDGRLVDGREDAYQIEGIGIIYRNTLSKFLKDKFGAKTSPSHNDSRRLLFELPKLQAMARSYEEQPKIKVTMKDDRQESGSQQEAAAPVEIKVDSSDGSDGFWEQASTIR
jgi:hypothetical protein